MSSIYLDCDGVLADFDRSAAEIFGMHPHEYEGRYGIRAFWKTLADTAGFFENLPLMPDALDLYEGVRHLSPSILTGCPRGGWAEAQKERWAAKHFPEAPIITCLAANKRCYCQPGDVLVDDSLKYRQLWEEEGGHFVHHHDAERTLSELRHLLPGEFEPPAAER